jgi:hypothetical protein
MTLFPSGSALVRVEPMELVSALGACLLIVVLGSFWILRL